MAKYHAFAKREAGVLCHPTSIPGGDFGPGAYHFIDFLAVSGFSLWQLLPLNPTDAEGSPYIGRSALALNTVFVSPHLLREWGWLPADASTLGDAMFDAALRYFAEHASKTDKRRYQAFLTAQSHWLDAYAVFEVIKSQQAGLPWYEWPPALRDAKDKAIVRIRSEHADAIERTRFAQFVADRQWQALRDYARDRGVRVFGDLPIFVSHDSVDVWANREDFLLYKNGQPKVVAGVPPDYFSETGQRWGNPLYNWEAMKKDGFQWWLHRIQRQLELYDIIRIDHFRGFEAYWEINAKEELAIKGKWVKAPGDALFKALHKEFGRLPLVAEDLGVITKDVTALRHRYHLPGMKILQFAFDGDVNNAYLPHNHVHDCVVYSGTHDNDTTQGWYDGLAGHDRQRVNDYLGCRGEEMPWPIIRASLASVAQTAVVPMQDLLGMGNEARMNVPGVKSGNWQWSFHWEQVPDGLSDSLLAMNRRYARYRGDD